jgi:hypothetical protein
LRAGPGSTRSSDAIRSHVDHLGHRGVGIVVTDDPVSTRLDGHLGRRIPKVTVREPVVDAREVDAHPQGSLSIIDRIVAGAGLDDREAMRRLADEFASNPPAQREGGATTGTAAQDER